MARAARTSSGRTRIARAGARSVAGDLAAGRREGRRQGASRGSPGTGQRLAGSGAGRSGDAPPRGCVRPDLAQSNGAHTPLAFLPPRIRRGAFGTTARRINLLTPLAKQLEALGGPDKLSVHIGVTSVPSAVDDDELGARPDASEIPGVPDRRLKVETSVHEEPGDIGQRARAAKQALVIEPRVVANVVGHDAREGQRICRVAEPFSQACGRRPLERRGLPEAPRLGGSLPNHSV